MRLHLPKDITAQEISAAMLSIGLRVAFKNGDLVVKERCIPASGWHPISQPPPMLEDVLVTVMDEYGKPMTHTAFWQGHHAWFDNDAHPIAPTAWMPLPKPYTGEKR